jgi:hypothetical protein
MSFSLVKHDELSFLDTDNSGVYKRKRIACNNTLIIASQTTEVLGNKREQLRVHTNHSNYWHLEEKGGRETLNDRAPFFEPWRKRSMKRSATGPWPWSFQSSADGGTGTF